MFLFCCKQLSYNPVLCKLGYLNEHAFSLHAHSLNTAILTLTTFSEMTAHVYITWSIIRSCYILKIVVVYCHLADFAMISLRGVYHFNSFRLLPLVLVYIS